MATPNPLEKAHSRPPPPVSCRTLHIAGISTDVYGLKEIPSGCQSISCLWLLHPRGGTKESMANMASALITDWQKRVVPDASSKVGFIAVAFDQRNHGTRMAHGLANESWRGGNVTHAPDMYSIYAGTALDTSLLIDHLNSYIFHEGESPAIGQHLVAGISLGGHSAWHVLFNEPRVSAAVAIIGCPDYALLMKDRARLSKLKSYTSSGGTDFLGSKDFPKALVSTIQKTDPKAMLFGTSEVNLNLSETEEKRLRNLLDAKVKGKQVLLCFGGDDKLVPHRCSKPYLDFLKKAASGWYKDGNLQIEDIVYPGVGHAYSEGMAKDTSRFIGNILANASTGKSRGISKI